MHKVRDAVYLAMAPDRQIDENNPTVSLVSSIEQENQADASQIINSAPKGGCCGILAQRTKFVITHDRLIMVKENQNGFKYEFTDLFLIDLQGLESTSPPAYPMWYVWLYWFPPAGLCGCHRYKLGQRGCGLYLYAVTLGYFGFRKISMFVLLAVVHEFSDIMLFLVCRLVDWRILHVLLCGWIKNQIPSEFSVSRRRGSRHKHAVAEIQRRDEITSKNCGWITPSP